MMPLEDYKFTRSQEKINHIMYMDDITVFAKDFKEMVTDTNNKDIKLG